MFQTGRVHAVVDGEIAADQVRAHGGVFAGLRLGRTDCVGDVFAVVDADDACVAFWGAVGFVGWFGPVAAAAEACWGTQ